MGIPLTIEANRCVTALIADLKSKGEIERWVQLHRFDIVYANSSNFKLIAYLNNGHKLEIETKRQRGASNASV